MFAFSSSSARAAGRGTGSGAASVTAPRPRLIAGLAAFSVAMLGGLATDLSPWYYALEQPSWRLPDWVFGPAWMLIFTLTAAAAALAWEAAPEPRIRRRLTGLFALNGALNVLWSVLFFTLQRPDWALLEVSALWTSIVVLILACWPWRRLAAMLLVPYLLWVSFASALTFAVVALNGPF